MPGTAGSLLLDYALQEERRGERIVAENDSWLVVVPFWAVWPFETLLLPKAPAGRLSELNEEQRLDLASILKRLLVKYDSLVRSLLSLFDGLAWRALRLPMRMRTGNCTRISSRLCCAQPG